MTRRPNTTSAPRRKRRSVLQRRAVAASSRGWMVGLVAVFVVVHLPLLGDYTWHHADEYLYTDAVVRMLDAGDLSTPRYADGTLRFNKPLLTYWAVAASFATFGAHCSELPEIPCRSTSGGAPARPLTRTNVRPRDVSIVRPSQGTGQRAASSS